MNDLMNCVSSQIQRAISEAMNEQALAQIQSTLRYEQGQQPGEGWNVPVRDWNMDPKKPLTTSVGVVLEMYFPEA